jgi:hypothetical protein
LYATSAVLKLASDEGKRALIKSLPISMKDQFQPHCIEGIQKSYIKATPKSTSSQSCTNDSLMNAGIHDGEQVVLTGN